MWAEATFNGVGIQMIDDEDGTLLVQFDWEGERKQHRCRRCDMVFANEDDAELDGCAEAECMVHTGDENCDDHACEYGGHDLVEEDEPLSWANSAGLHFNESKDQIDLSISLGDPRGAFVMSVFRLPNGQIRMEVPHPKDGFLHLPLRQIGTAVYIVNETAPEEGE